MNRFLVHADVLEIAAIKQPEPTTVMWNRLEPRPHCKDYSRALKAEVRDPLWLLTRQWQMGEFTGDDAASPVSAKIAWSVDRLNRLYSDAGATEEFDARAPIEAIIEARPVMLDHADVALALGQRWEALLRADGKAGLIPSFRTEYAFDAPDPDAAEDNLITASAESWQVLAAIAGRATDGGALLAYLGGTGTLASDKLGLAGTDKARADSLGEQFKDWAKRLYFGTHDDFDAWRSRHLEYKAGLSAPLGTSPAALSADEYHGGRMDWYHFDAVPAGTLDTAGPAATIERATFLPTTAQFDGMPNTRHWAFEEGRVNFGEIKPDKNDLAKLLLIEFGLMYANDWFLLPMELPSGSLTNIMGLAVTNVFGERHWIETAVTPGGPIGSWQMYRLTAKGANDGRLFLPPVAPPGLESDPVEAVDFVRDEVANMVWGIERVVQLHDGSSRPGREVAMEVALKFDPAISTASPPAAASGAVVKYRLMNSVAEHWIPFIPIHVPNDPREVQLQRAAMPRLIAGATGTTPDKIRPRTTLLSEGVAGTSPTAYYVAEEEIERAGTDIETRWQRCRWTNGETLLWLAHKRSVGRGEASSGLAFDFVEPLKR